MRSLLRIPERGQKAVVYVLNSDACYTAGALARTVGGIGAPDVTAPPAGRAVVGHRL